MDISIKKVKQIREELKLTHDAVVLNELLYMPKTHHCQVKSYYSYCPNNAKYRGKLNGEELWLCDRCYNNFLIGAYEYK